MFGKGISRAGDVLDLAAGIDLVKKAGHGMLTKERRLGRGEKMQKLI